MSLAEETWEECSVQAVFAAFLAAERQKYVDDGVPGDWLQLIDEPNLDDKVGNARRQRMLYARRRPILGEIGSSVRRSACRSSTRFAAQGHGSCCPKFCA